MTDPTDLTKLAWVSVLLPGNETVRPRAGVELEVGNNLATLLINLERLGGDRSMLLSTVESAVLNAGMYADQEQVEEVAAAIVAELKRG